MADNYAALDLMVDLDFNQFGDIVVGHPEILDARKAIHSTIHSQSQYWNRGALVFA